MQCGILEQKKDINGKARKTHSDCSLNSTFVSVVFPSFDQCTSVIWISLVAQNPPANPGDMVSILGREDPLEKEMTTPSSILAGEIPWTEEPGRLQSVGSQRVGHDLATKQPQ